MARKVLTTIKLQAPGGQASPAPPVGPALGQHGINIMEFVKAFNAQTQGDMGTTIPVVITVYEDRSFTFITKTPPAAVLIRQATGIEKGAALRGGDGSDALRLGWSGFGEPVLEQHADDRAVRPPTRPVEPEAHDSPVVDSAGHDIRTVEHPPQQPPGLPRLFLVVDLDASQRRTPLAEPVAERLAQMAR